MFYRQEIVETLPELRERVAETSTVGERTRVSPDEIKFHTSAADPAIQFGNVEVPASPESMKIIGDYLKVPTAFMGRLIDNVSAPVVDALFNDMVTNSIRKDLGIGLNGTGTAVTEITEWDRRARIQAHQVMDAVISAYAPTAPKVARFIHEPGTHLAFDAYFPFEDSETARARGIGGDFGENDLTASGVRIDINLKQGLTPSVQPFTYRRICTNGMETPMAGLKIEGRGQTVEEVLAELESMARLAFAQAEKSIEHFYDLREQKVDNPERAITALGRERGIPDRSLVQLVELAAGEDMPDNPSMFDVVNLVTNFANAPQVRNDGGRLLLERAGGAVVNDHSARCGHCQQKVV